eukprot:6786500-Ditylum_brightwellii.AAC.1
MEQVCAVLTVSKGKPTTTDILTNIPKFNETNRYKYVGVTEGCNFLTKEVKQSSAKAYTSCIWKILSSGLTRNKMMAAICAFVIPVL